MNLLQKGKTAVIRLYQRRAFQKEIILLENERAISSQSSIYKLDPYLDNDGLLRVSGGINKANLDCCLKHPVLLPKECRITHAIIRDHHENVANAGWEMTINEIHNHGYWIINCASAVRLVISKCVECRKVHGNIYQQKMMNLPAQALKSDLSEFKLVIHLQESPRSKMTRVKQLCEYT